MTVPAMSSWLQLALLVFLGWNAHAETGCPPPEDIVPCHCTDVFLTRLICHGLTDTEDLRSVFENSEKYFYHEVLIRSSSFRYIPHDIFVRTKVGQLVVVDSTLTTLFDLPPRSDSLYKIELDNTTIQWKNLFQRTSLEHFTNLREIVVNKSSSITNIPADFGSRLPSSLRQISFYDTTISHILPGAFNGLENLDMFALRFSQLNNLTREAFPRPFNVGFLFFNNNNISSLPGDIFTEMPNLQFVTLRNNLLTVLPEETFSRRSTSVLHISVTGNPINCNCLLLWLIKDKQKGIVGTCAEPTRLRGKRLKDLAPADFNC